MITAQVHDKFKVFVGELTPDNSLGKLADAVAAFGAKVAAKSIGVEFVESANKVVITLGYRDDEKPYPIRLHTVPLGKIDLMASDFSKLEKAMADASGKVQNIICHELFLTTNKDFFLVLMTHES